MVQQNLSNDALQTSGRKIFFIAPDKKNLPESCLVNLLSQGYETYLIELHNSTEAYDLQYEIKNIATAFPGSIVFFNVSASLGAVNWKKLLADIHAKYSSSLLLGAMGNGSSTDAADFSNLECGYIALDSDVKKNETLLVGVFNQYSAQGRRTMVRAKCDNSSGITFSFDKQAFSAKILDVNISCFSVMFDETVKRLAIYDKITDASININGYRFNSDVVLLMRSQRDGKPLYVFMFIKPDGSPDLESETSEKLCNKIYEMTTESCNAILHGFEVGQ